MNDTYEPVIGLEIHAELKTKTKMFCRCLNDPFASEPNSNVCPVCLGLPGALPVVNQEAVERTIMVGLALHCQIASQSKWDRKNYFYPDLPKGYQISQYDLPLCTAGNLTVEVDGRAAPIRITRIHLEEDTGTLQHPSGAAYSLVSYNRSGVPLMELVTEPDIRSGKEARLFAEEYRRILRALGVAEADMEKGELRVEANVSIRTKEQAKSNQFGTKVEVKNLNSFRSAEKAINFEIARQAKVLDAGEKIIQETRGWHDDKQITFSQRTKEEAADYRYFPEPDLPPLAFTDQQIAAIKAKMPALPNEARQSFINQGLTSADAEVLINDRAKAAYYTELVGQAVTPKLAANWAINEIPDQVISASALAELLKKLESGEISSKIAKDVALAMKASGQTAGEIIAQKGLAQLSDQAAIEAIVDQVLADNATQVAEYRAGKQQLFGYLVGQVMQKANGQANPQVLNQVLRNKLAA